MLLRSMQNTRRELADAKAENDAHVMMLPLVVVGCTSAITVSQCVKPPPPPAWIMQPPPDWRHRTGLFHLRERLITMQKQLDRTGEHINEQDIAHTMGNSCNYCEQYTRASSEYKCLK